MFPRMEWPDIGGVSHSSLSHREECLLLRCPPLLLTSPTNSQSGLILEILSSALGIKLNI